MALNVPTVVLPDVGLATTIWQHRLLQPSLDILELFHFIYSFLLAQIYLQILMECRLFVLQVVRQAWARGEGAGEAFPPPTRNVRQLSGYGSIVITLPL